MGILFCEGAVTVEGPPAQGVNTDIPSETKGSGGCESLLEVRLEAYFSFFFFVSSFVAFSHGFSLLNEPVKMINFHVNGVLIVIKLSTT